MVKTTINGVAFEVGPEPADYWQWIREGRYNHEWAVYDAHLKPEHIFIDLGAWVGAHSLYASSITPYVTAFEPDPVAFAILEHNVDSTNIAAVNRAVGIQGKVKMGSGWLGASTTRINPLAGGGIGAWAEDQTFDVKSITLRGILGTIASPSFIKIDVEGSEEEILKDVVLFAEHIPTVLIELHPFWWKDAAQTWKDFEAVKALYKNSREIIGNSWLLYA